MKLLRSLAVAFAVYASAGGASAQYANQCAQQLRADDLAAVNDEAGALSESFKAAFNSLPLDKSMASISAVGATMVGHAMPREMSAAADGLRHLVQLRDQIRQPESHAKTVSQLSSAMRDSSQRMRKLSIDFGKVSRMANVKSVQDLAAQGMALSDRLAREWVCEQ